MTEHLRLSEVSLPEHIQAAFKEDGTLLVKDITLRRQSGLDRLKRLGAVAVRISEAGVAEAGEKEAEDSLKADKIEVVASPLEETNYRVEKNKLQYDHTLQKMKSIFDREKKEIDSLRGIEELEEDLDFFVETVRDQPASLAAVTQLERYDDDTFQHSLNVSILAILYGEYRNYSEEALRRLALAALLHDLGKTRLPKKVIHKQEKLSAADWQLIREHPTQGRELLKKLGLDKVSRKVCYEHHERPNGQGYPEGTLSMHHYSRVTGVCDVYEALTAQRVYKQPLPPVQAFLELKREFYSYPETRRIITGLIRCLGLFPIGSIVELSNGTQGVVKENHPEDLRRPTVVVVRDSHGRLLQKPYAVNLLSSAERKQGLYRDVYDRGIYIIRVLSLEEHPEMGSRLSGLLETPLTFDKQVQEGLS